MPAPLLPYSLVASVQKHVASDHGVARKNKTTVHRLPLTDQDDRLRSNKAHAHRYLRHGWTCTSKMRLARYGRTALPPFAIGSAFHQLPLKQQGAKLGSWVLSLSRHVCAVESSVSRLLANNGGVEGSARSRNDHQVPPRGCWASTGCRALMVDLMPRHPAIRCF